MTWRWPLAVPTKPRADPAERIAALAVTAVSTLWIAAGLAATAGASEVWRYVLLLRSRDGALSRTSLSISDALVATAGIMTWLFGLLSAVVVVLWALRARIHAHERANLVPSRPDWQILAGILVPGPNLFIPGSTLAELEHSALAGAGEQVPESRPRPSRLVRLWWLTWCTSLVLGWLAILWGLRDSVQALANGVLLHLYADLAACALALLTIVVVRRFTRLLVPPDPTLLPRRHVLRVRGAPDPQRPPRPSGAPR